MKVVNNFFRFILLCTILNLNTGWAGNEGGGGDPDAVDFLWRVKILGEWAIRTHSGLTDTDAQKVNNVAKKINQLMDDSSATPILFVDQDLFDPSGASKIALFDLKTFKIQVTRSKWQSLHDEDKFVVAALELFGLSQLENRYAIAGIVKKEINQIEQIENVVEQYWSYISAVKVGEIVSYESPGIFKPTQEIFPMAINLKNIDVDFEDQTTGKKIATEFCKALGHEIGLTVSFKTQTYGTIGAFFKIAEGYVGLRQLNVAGIQPDVAVQHLNCK